MKIRCIWEHNGEDSLLYSDNFPGAFTRGESKEVALGKMKQEVESYLRWAGEGESKVEISETEIVQEKSSDLEICNADSDVLFDKERELLTLEEYRQLKALALKSAEDFLKNEVFLGSYGEEWSLRKVLRRFIWHDRIHAKGMYRMAKKTFGEKSVPDIFRFEK